MYFYPKKNFIINIANKSILHMTLSDPFDQFDAKLVDNKIEHAL